MVDISGLLIHGADESFAAQEQPTGEGMLENAQELLDVAVDVSLAFVPPASVSKSALTLLAGKNLITGQKLTGRESGFEVVNIVSVGAVGAFGKTGKFLLKMSAAEGAAGRTAKMLLGHLELADQAARRERTFLQRGKEFTMGRDAATAAAYVGLAADARVVEKVGVLLPHEITIATHFGGLDGVLVSRSVEFQKVPQKWGVSDRGFSQLSTRVFLSTKREIGEQIVRLAALEEKAGLVKGVLTNALMQSSVESVTTAFFQFDNLASVVEKNETAAAKFGKKKPISLCRQSIRQDGTVQVFPL